MYLDGNIQLTNIVKDVMFYRGSSSPQVRFSLNTLHARWQLVVYSKETGKKLIERKSDGVSQDYKQKFEFPELHDLRAVYVELKLRNRFSTQTVFRVGLSDSLTLTRKRVPEIPKVIYTYWHSPIIPEFVQGCISGWGQMNPNHQVVVLNRVNLADYISRPLPDRFDHVIAQFQSDWVRYAVLAEHGGIWIDASTILTQSLDWLHFRQQAEQVEHVFYYLDDQVSHSLITVENWFIAALPNTTFMNKWSSEWTFALQNFDGNGRRYVAWLVRKYGFRNALRAEGFLNQFSKISMVSYLCGYIAARKIIATDGIVPSAFYISADDSAFKIPVACRWDSECTVREIVMKPAPADVYSLVKLVRWHRNAILQHLSLRGFVHPQSILARYVPMKNLQ
jgi:hypothetical protein